MKEEKHPNTQTPKHPKTVANVKPFGIWIFGYLKFSCLLFGVWCFTSFAAPLKIELPPETASFKPDVGVEFANAQCLVCHSVEYVSTQPKKDRAFWAASVKKMQEKFGAPIPPEQVEPLADYLTKNYGIATNITAATTPSPQPSIPQASSKDGPKIATKYGCLTCHNVSMKIVGPSYHEIAAKYKGDSQASPKIEEQIQKGGSGKWGPMLMPPFPQVSETERKVLVDWILSQK